MTLVAWTWAPLFVCDLLLDVDLDLLDIIGGDYFEKHISLLLFLLPKSAFLRLGNVAHSIELFIVSDVFKLQLLLAQLFLINFFVLTQEFV